MLDKLSAMWINAQIGQHLQNTLTFGLFKERKKLNYTKSTKKKIKYNYISNKPIQIWNFAYCLFGLKSVFYQTTCVSYPLLQLNMMPFLQDCQFLYIYFPRYKIISLCTGNMNHNREEQKLIHNTIYMFMTFFLFPHLNMRKAQECLH